MKHKDILKLLHSKTKLLFYFYRSFIDHQMTKIQTAVLYLQLEIGIKLTIFQIIYMIHKTKKY